MFLHVMLLPMLPRCFSLKGYHLKISKVLVPFPARCSLSLTTVGILNMLDLQSLACGRQTQTMQSETGTTAYRGNCILSLGQLILKDHT